MNVTMVSEVDDFEDHEFRISKEQAQIIESPSNSQHYLFLKAIKKNTKKIYFVCKVDETGSQFSLEIGDFIILHPRDSSMLGRRPSQRVLAILQTVRSYQDRYRVWKPEDAEAAILNVTYNVVEKLRREILPASPSWILNQDNSNNDWTYLATRTFLLKHMTDYWPNDESIGPWLNSPSRFTEIEKHCIKNTIAPFIRHLFKQAGQVTKSLENGALERFWSSIWNRFCIDFSNYFQNGSYHLILHNLTPMYMSVIAKKLQEKGLVPKVTAGPNGGKKNNNYKITTEHLESRVNQLSSTVLGRCPKSKFGNVIEILKKYLVQTDWCNSDHTNTYDGNCIIVTVEQVADWLYDLEQSTWYLTRINELNTVRVKMSALENVTPAEVSSSSHDHRIEKFNDVEFIEESPSIAGSALTNESHDKSTVGDSTGNAREYSLQKVEGSRVYAEYSNGNYYWGVIAHVNPKTLRYLINFEDGDILGNIPHEKIFTETQYKKLFEEDPPTPPKPTKASTSRSDRRGRRSSSNRSPNSSVTKERRPKRARKSNGIESSEPPTRTNETKNTAMVQSVDTKLQSINKQLSTTSNIDGKVRPLCCKKLYQGSLITNKPFKCGHCQNCITEQSYCLQTVCQHMDEPAPGFPAGWTFYWVLKSEKGTDVDAHFTVCRMVNHIYERSNLNQQSSLKSLRIISPKRQKFKSIIQAAVVAANEVKFNDDRTIASDFLSNLGLVDSLEEKHSFLVGKAFCHDWTDANGTNHVLFGKIIDISKPLDVIEPILFKWSNDFTLKVQYSEVSLRLNNSEEDQIQIPGVLSIPNDLAWGGCVQYERKRRNQVSRIVHRNIDRTMPCKSWIIPEMRKEDTCQFGFPRLTIVIRGFELCLYVKIINENKESHNDNLRVFCKCNSLLDQDDSSFFDLQAGELLDLGVCAPFSKTDRKHFSVWKVKNYIFEESCEEWCYMTENKNYCYDLTDDRTGKVHEKAKSHLLSYINECHPDDVDAHIPSVHAEIDPAQHIHYLLGVPFRGVWNEYEEGMKKLNLSSGGYEVPLHVNFGPRYEKVRTKLYRSNASDSSTNHKKTNDRKQQASSISLKDVLSNSTYGHIILVLDYLSNGLLKNSENDIDQNTKKRAQIVVGLIKARMHDLKKKSVDVSDDDWENMFQSIEDISGKLFS